MNNEKFLQNLENVCLDNVFMLYQNKRSSFKNYVMACNTNDIYNCIMGEELFDELEFSVDFPDIYQKMDYYENFYSDKHMRNIFSFRDIIMNYGNVINFMLTDSVNKWNKENKLCCKNLDKEDVYDLGNYFIESNNLDNNLIDKFIKNNRIGMFDVCDGFFLPDLIDDNDFIVLPLDKLDYYQVASTLAHEAGHSDDYNNMTKREKELYSYLSVYKEVKSESMQNKFNDFLVDDKICVSIGNYLKKSQLYTMYYYFNESMKLFNDIDRYKEVDRQQLIDSVTYSVGFLTAYYLDYYKEKENTFNEAHKKCYDSSLLYGLDINENRVSKILKKEINNIK